MIFRLVLITINTGLWTAVFAVVDLILVSTRPSPGCCRRHQRHGAHPIPFFSDPSIPGPALLLRRRIPSHFFIPEHTPSQFERKSVRSRPVRGGSPRYIWWRGYPHERNRTILCKPFIDPTHVYQSKPMIEEYLGAEKLELKS